MVEIPLLPWNKLAQKAIKETNEFPKCKAAFPGKRFQIKF